MNFLLAAIGFWGFITPSFEETFWTGKYPDPTDRLNEHDLWIRRHFEKYGDLYRILSLIVFISNFFVS